MPFWTSYTDKENKEWAYVGYLRVYRGFQFSEFSLDVTSNKWAAISKGTCVCVCVCVCVMRGVCVCVCVCVWCCVCGGVGDCLCGHGHWGEQMPSGSSQNRSATS